MKRKLHEILKSSFVVNLFIICGVQEVGGRITFGVVNDDGGYAVQTVDVINYIMHFVNPANGKLQYTIKYIDPSVPLTKQLEGICYSEEDFDVLFSATCCRRLHDLAKESSSNGILHFAVNIDHCVSKNNSAVLLDRMPMQDVAQAIADVVDDRNRKADIVVLHDTHYERPSTVKSLLKELTSRGIRYSYLLFDVNVTKVSRRVEMVRKGADQMSTVVLADFNEFKSLVDKMYENHVLDSSVSYLIINDGWEYENPEIEVPQPINYTIDLHLLLLKRQISEQFSNFLKNILDRNGEKVLERFVRWKVPYIVRGDLFVAAAVWSVAEALKLVQTSTKLKMQNKCPSFNETVDHVGSNEFTRLTMKLMQEIGVLSDSLQYDLFRNIPVDTKTEIFRPIARWKVQGNPRLQYLSPNIESRLLFENRTLKLGMPFVRLWLSGFYVGTRAAHWAIADGLGATPKDGPETDDSSAAIYRHLHNLDMALKVREILQRPCTHGKLRTTDHILQNPPYTFRADEDDEEIEKGAVIKLFDYLTKRLKFKYEVLQPEDNEWGVLMDDGKWSGTISMLLDRTVDLVPFLGITRGRNKVVQFSEPVMTTSSAILIQKPREPPRTLIFLRPFAGHVWFLIGFMIPIMSFVLFLVNKKSWYYMHENQKKMKGGLFKFRNCFWYMYGAILQQGGIHLPETTSARIIVCFWWLFVMVTMATYSGNLIAFLTFPEADWKVNSVHDLAQKMSLTVTVMEGTSIHQEIEESPMETLQILKRRFLYHQNAVYISNISSVLEDIEEGNVAYIDDFYVLSELIKIQHNKTGKCKLALAPKTFQEIYLAIAFRKGSPYMKDINNYIRRLWHGGLMQWWAEQYAQLKSHECYFVTTTLRGGRKDVTLNDLLGAFLMLVSGLGISLFMIIFEVIWTQLRKQCSSQRKKTFANRNCVNYISTVILKKILAL